MSPVWNQPSCMTSAVASGALPVALHDVVAADLDLADLALRHSFRSSSTTAARRPRSACRSSPACARASGWLNDATGDVSRQAVALEDHRVERLLELAHDLDRQRGAARDAQPQAGDVVRRRPAPSSAWYIVGTPSKTVTRSRLMISSALRGSKRGISVSARAGRRRRSSRTSARRRGTAAAPRGSRRRSVACDERAGGHLGVAAQVRVGELGALRRARSCRRCRGSPRCRSRRARLVLGAPARVAERCLELAGRDADRPRRRRLERPLVRGRREVVPGEQVLRARVARGRSSPRGP